MIDGDAFVAAVTTNGTEIDKVVHLGRKPTVLQKTALEWFSAGECSTEGCTNSARIEIDHVADWADTKITPAPRPRVAVRVLPRPQDPPGLHLRTEAPLREATG